MNARRYRYIDICQAANINQDQPSIIKAVQGLYRNRDSTSARLGWLREVTIPFWATALSVFKGRIVSRLESLTQLVPAIGAYEVSESFPQHL